MNARPSLIAFLLACFLLTGLVGLFASYGPAIPLERALHRIEQLDRGVAPVADAGERPLPSEPAAARDAVIAQARAEAAAVGARTRLLLGLMTAVAAAIGAFLLLLASRLPRGSA